MADSSFFKIDFPVRLQVPISSHALVKKETELSKPV